MSGTDHYKPLETSETEHPKKTHAILNNDKITFTREYSGLEEQQQWVVRLPFKGWSMAMHPPSNVVAVSEDPKSPSRVNIHILDMDGNSVCSEGPLVHDFKEKRFLYSDRPKISISKNTVAVLFRAGHIIPQDSNTLADALVVWNWLTGEELCVLEGSCFNDITLIDDTWLLAGRSVFKTFGLGLMDTSTKPDHPIHFYVDVSDKTHPTNLSWEVSSDETSRNWGNQSKFDHVSPPPASGAVVKAYLVDHSRRSWVEIEVPAPDLVRKCKEVSSNAEWEDWKGICTESWVSHPPEDSDRCWLLAL